MKNSTPRAAKSRPSVQPREAEPNLGECLRSLRFRRKLSITDVSIATGISKSTLSRVESDQLSLTYDKLVQLCRGLRIDFATLFSNDPTQNGIGPLGRRTFTLPDSGRSVPVNLQSYLYLCTELAGKKMTPMTGIIHSRTLDETNGLLKHDGEEFTYVLEGKLELNTEFYEPLILGAGGSVYFDSTMGHAYVSIGDVPLKILCVCSTPEPILIQQIGQPIENARSLPSTSPASSKRQVRTPATRMRSHSARRSD